MVETGEIMSGVVEDLLAGREKGEISSSFHRTMAEVVVAGCERIREAGGASAVALSGGTFQNLLLLEQVIELLAGKGFAVYRHRRVPANDGGLALGQAVLADRLFGGDRRQRGMCLGIPGRIVEILDEDSSSQRPRWAESGGT